MSRTPSTRAAAIAGALLVVLAGSAFVRSTTANPQNPAQGLCAWWAARTIHYVVNMAGLKGQGCASQDAAVAEVQAAFQTWHGASRAVVLDSFQLLAVRRAPRGAAVVTVRERFWRGDRDGPLVRSISEYLVGRLNGAWKVVDRRPGGVFDDASLAEGYAGFFDAAPPPR